MGWNSWLRCEEARRNSRSRRRALTRGRCPFWVSLDTVIPSCANPRRGSDSECVVFMANVILRLAVWPVEIRSTS